MMNEALVEALRSEHATIESDIVVDAQMNPPIYGLLYVIQFTMRFPPLFPHLVFPARILPLIAPLLALSL